MKNLLIVVVVILLASCSQRTRRSYSVIEVETLIITKGCSVYPDSMSVGGKKYPVVKIGGNIYYPEKRYNNVLMYNQLKK